MLNTLSAPELRRYAMRCHARADNPACSQQERKRLMDMQVSFLTLAETADWLAGKSADALRVYDRLAQDVAAQDPQPAVRSAAAAMK